MKGHDRYVVTAKRQQAKETKTDMPLLRCRSSGKKRRQRPGSSPPGQTLQRVRGKVDVGNRKKSILQSTWIQAEKEKARLHLSGQAPVFFLLFHRLFLPARVSGCGAGMVVMVAVMEGGESSLGRKLVALLEPLPRKV